MTHYFLPVLYSLLQILILAGIGFVLRRFAGWDQSIFSGISRLIVKVTLPVMFVSRMASMNRSDLISGAFFPFYTFIILGISFVLSFAASRLFRIPRESRRVYMALSSFSNVGYIPLALTDILASSIDGFGEFFGFPLPSLYIGSFIFTYSPMIWSLGSSMITGASGGRRLKQFITPPVVGIFTGVLLSILGSGPLIADSRLPFHYIFGGLKTLGSVTSPLVLIVLGAMVGELEFSRSLSRRKMVFALSPMLIRYLALPAGFLTLLNTIPALQNLAPAFLLILFMESVVPPAANFSIITKNAGKNEKETAMSLLVTYAAYLLIFPLYLMIFLHLLRF